MTIKRFSLFLLVLGGIVMAYPHMAMWWTGQENDRISADYISEHERGQERHGEFHYDDKLEDLRECNEFLKKRDDLFLDPFSGDEDEALQACYEEYSEDVFAILEIPNLDVTLPLYLGASEDHLSRGAAQVDGSSVPVGGVDSHALIAGHRGMATKEMFRHLDRLDEGDLFHIHVFHETLTYEIFETEVIKPWETSHLTIREGRDLVTLFTCHPYRSNEQRLLVWGERK